MDVRIYGRWTDIKAGLGGVDLIKLVLACCHSSDLTSDVPVLSITVISTNVMTLHHYSVQQLSTKSQSPAPAHAAYHDADLAKCSSDSEN